MGRGTSRRPGKLGRTGAAVGLAGKAGGNQVKKQQAQQGAKGIHDQVLQFEVAAGDEELVGLIAQAVEGGAGKGQEEGFPGERAFSPQQGAGEKEAQQAVFEAVRKAAKDFIATERLAGRPDGEGLDGRTFPITRQGLERVGGGGNGEDEEHT
jgi:hypothetical protein